MKGTPVAGFPVSQGAGGTDRWQVTEEQKQEQHADYKMSQLKGAFDSIPSDAPFPGPVRELVHPRLFIFSRKTGRGPSL